jgi:hypothetical protein
MKSPRVFNSILVLTGALNGEASIQGLTVGAYQNSKLGVPRGLAGLGSRAFEGQNGCYRAF